MPSDESTVSRLFGGCVQPYEVAAVTRDGSVVRSGVLLHDTALGAVNNQVCATESRIEIEALLFDEAAGTSEKDVQLGKVNPNYPRWPGVPVC